MSSNVTDEIDTHSTRPLVLHVAVQAKVSEMAFKFSSEKRSGLSATSISRLLRAEQDKIMMGRGAGGEAWPGQLSVDTIRGNWEERRVGCVLV